MAKVTPQLIQDTVERILQGEDVRDIKTEMKKKGYSGTQCIKLIEDCKEYVSEAANDLRDILPDLNLYRLNQLYTTSVNSAPKDRAYIVKEMNSMLGLNRQEIDLNMNYVFEIGADDEVAKLEINEDNIKNVAKLLGEDDDDENGDND